MSGVSILHAFNFSENTDSPTSTPFSQLIINDSTLTDTFTITLTPSTGAGTLSLNGAVLGTTYTDTIGNLSKLKLLTFTPTSNGVVNVSITVNRAGVSTPLAASAETITVSCFVPGTLISCPDGARAIETLSPGDLVVTASGKASAIRFVGHRHLDLSANPDHSPVRIPAGALGDGIPSRTLRISPDHAVMMEGVLVPARSLLGGAIVQEDWSEVTYYHIQLEQHDVLLAEDAPCETLLESDDLSMFDNGHEAVETDAFLAPCLPRITQGPVVEFIRSTIEARLAITA